MSHVPLVAPEDRREVFGRALDEDLARRVFQRELGAMAEGPIEIVDLEAKGVMSRSSLRAGRMRVVYDLTIASESEGKKDYVLIGTTPVAEDFIGEAMLEQARLVENHPWVRPFKRLVLFVPELEMVVHLLPVDPQMPAIAELTGPGGAAVLAPHLPECRAGATIEGLDCKLLNYRPGNRCVLKVKASILSLDGERTSRLVFVKIFDQDREESYLRMRAIWDAGQGCESLRMPEPLGYDRARMTLFIAGVPGERDLVTWVKRLKKDDPLPEGVDLNRVHRALGVAADALADLRRCDVELARRLTLHDQVEDLRKDVALLEQTNADLGREYGELLDRLAAAAPDDEPLVPAHGGFRHNQLLGDEKTLTVFDWGDVLMAGAAFDAANFLRRLRKDSLKNPGSAQQLEKLAEVFRQEFLAREPQVERADLARYECLTLLETAVRSARRQSGQEEMERQLEYLASEARGILDGLAG